MKFTCPQCGHILEIAKERVARAMVCPGCQRPFIAPAARVPGAKEPTYSATTPIYRPPAASGSAGQSGESGYQPPHHKGGGGFFRFLMLLVLLAAGAFGYAMFRFNEPPQKVWKRLQNALATPQKTQPISPPTPVAPPEPTATPTPTPTVSPTPAPSVDPITWLLEHKDRTPKEVSLLKSETLSITLNSEVTGSMTAPAGTKVLVVGVDAQTIDVRLANATGQFPHDATNLRELAQAEMEKPEPVPTTVAPAPTQPPTAQPPAAKPDSPFCHPGVVLTAAQLKEIRNGVLSGREPWKSWFARYDGDPGTVSNEGQFEEYGRNADIHRGEFQSDMWQLYRMAMLWVVKKDHRAAKRGIGILENYAKNHKRFVGVEASFMQGDCMNGIVAAEILRSTYPGWTEQNTIDIKRYFSDVWWQTIRVGNENCGAGSHLWTANQGTIGLKVGMATSIFCDDKVRFNMCLNAYLTDPLTGLENSLPNGEVGDTGRDTGHWTAEAIDDGWICQLAWAQGVDLFAQRNNRIIAISEFLAQNQLFCAGVIKENARYIPYGCSYDFYSDVSRFNDFRGHDFFEVIHAYAHMKHIPAPFTRQLLEHEKHKPVFTLDDSIPAQPTSAAWTQPLVAPVTSLRSKDIGPSHGSTSQGGNEWSLNSGSKRMEDSYHFAYIDAEGDWTFVTRVTKGGTIIATERLEPTPKTQAIWFEAREDGSCVHWSHGQHSYLLPWDLKHFGGARLPLWLKLVRRGVFISAWQSVDGTNWAPAAHIRFTDSGNKFYVGLATCTKPAKFDNVAFGAAPSSMPTAPVDVNAMVTGDKTRVRWKRGVNTVFCDVLRAETPGGPYATVGARITGNQFTDMTERGKTYYYVISPAGYSGRGPNSKEVYVHGF